MELFEKRGDERSSRSVTERESLKTNQICQFKWFSKRRKLTPIVGLA